MKPMTFALAADETVARPAFQELAEAIARRGGPPLRALWVPSYAALAQVVEAGVSDLAWTPPVVGLDLVRSGAALGLVAVARASRAAYYAALVARAGHGPRSLRALEGARMGWVSRLSAAGYRVPRLHLISLGLDPDTTFREQRFFASHDGVYGALQSGVVDVAATYASLEPGGGVVRVGRDRSDLAVLTMAGPIPSDVVVARPTVGGRERRALLAAFGGLRFPAHGALARFLGVESFVELPHGHFDPLRRWARRAEEGTLSVMRQGA